MSLRGGSDGDDNPIPKYMTWLLLTRKTHHKIFLSAASSSWCHGFTRHIDGRFRVMFVYLGDGMFGLDLGRHCQKCLRKIQHIKTPCGKNVSKLTKLKADQKSICCIHKVTQLKLVGQTIKSQRLRQ